MKTQDIFFVSEEHKERFIQIMRHLGKIDHGTFDPEYGAAFYVLSSDERLWESAQAYISRSSVDLPTMLEEVHFSSGFTVLIQWAGNLFSQFMFDINPIELMRLDERNFQVALTALLIRRYEPKI